MYSTTTGQHPADRTRSQLQYTYGKFLAFLSARHCSLLRSPADRINREIIGGFIKWQPKSCGEVTLAIYLYHLWGRCSTTFIRKKTGPGC